MTKEQAIESQTWIIASRFTNEEEAEKTNGQVRYFLHGIETSTFLISIEDSPYIVVLGQTYLLSARRFEIERLLDFDNKRTLLSQEVISKLIGRRKAFERTQLGGIFNRELKIYPNLNMKIIEENQQQIPSWLKEKMSQKQVK